jgi:hypothetical protein
LEKEDEESFDYYTDHFTSNIQSRDPLSAISELEDSLYHASKSAGLLAGKPKWIVMWSILLAYGLWRIQEDEEVVFRLKYAKFMLDKYEEEIGSKAVAYLRAKMIALSRFPSVPFVEGVSTDERTLFRLFCTRCGTFQNLLKIELATLAFSAKFEWNPDSVWAQTESNENAQERSAEVEVQAGGGADGSGMEVSAVDNLCGKLAARLIVLTGGLIRLYCRCN